MTVQILKMVTGEELIGDVEQNGNFTIKKPCFIQIMAGREPGQTMMGLVPYAPYVEDHTIVVPREAIIWVANPVKEMYNQYNHVFGSGIQLAV